jgi:hypothetical protein
MPIKGLTTDREPAFPRIGTLRKGGVKPNEKQPGKDLTYFRFDSDDKQAVQDFEAVYGKEPDTINVYLPFPTPDENFQAWQEEYKAGGLVHRCDGETMTVWQTPDGKYSNEPKPCPHKGKERTSVNPFCKPVGRLTVIIPELRRFAYVTVGTTSKNDIMELTDNLNAVYAMRGTLQGIPFRLMRRPRMISTPKSDGGRARYEKWMLSIEADPAWVNVQIASMQRQSLIAPDVKMLTGGRAVQVDTGEIFEDDEPAPTISSSLDDVDELDYGDGDDDGDTTSRPDWNNPNEAKAWAVEVGACANEFEAKNSLKKIVDEQFDGRLVPSNMDAVMDAFYARQMEKLASASDIPA